MGGSIATDQDADAVSFGDLLRQRRLAAGLTQEALAERAGLSKRGISDLERGARTRPQRETVKLLAEALGMSGLKRAIFVAAARRDAPTRRLVSSPATVSSTGAGLPAPVDPLIGREREVTSAGELLQRGETRLLTMTGPGGVGKTRLALAVAERVAGQFADGVVFVPLASLSDPALVASVVAERLGAPEQGEQPLRDALVAFIGRKRMLLVLDNFEHVLPAAPLVAALLGACPGLTVLITSRAAVHLSGEHIAPVAPLALPDAERLPPLADLGQTASVRLFVDRVRAVKPEFALSEANAAAVAAIVRRLDGLPLALELVAARARVLSPDALLARLDRSLVLLTGGAQDLPDRQRTLRDTFAWSYDLLRPDEQALFRRLAVYAGGCTLEAAEWMSGVESRVSGATTDTRRPTPDALDLVSTLLDNSLVQSEEPDAEPRFTMLATIREFALERQIERGEETATRDRHARYFRDLAEREHDEIFDTADPALLHAIEREHDNLRSALGWARDTGDHDTLLRLAGALGFFWYYRGHLGEGRHWLDQAVETPADDGAPRPRAWALTVAGMLANVSGATERAVVLLQESFPWWERSGEGYGRALAGSILGGVYVGQGQYDEAAPLLAASQDYFRAVGKEVLLSHATFLLGVVAWAQGDDSRAGALLREAVDCYERCGARHDAIDPLRYLGLAACAAGDHREAATWFAEEFTRMRQLGSRAALAVGLVDAATFAAAKQDWQTAARLFAAGEAMMQLEAAAFSLPARDHYERARDRVRDALGEAAFAAAAASGRALPFQQAIAEAEAVLERGHDGRGPAPP